MSKDKIRFSGVLVSGNHINNRLYTLPDVIENKKEERSYSNQNI